MAGTPVTHFALEDFENVPEATKINYLNDGESTRAATAVEEYKKLADRYWRFLGLDAWNDKRTLGHQLLDRLRELGAILKWSDERLEGEKRKMYSMLRNAGPLAVVRLLINFSHQVAKYVKFRDTESIAWPDRKTVRRVSLSAPDVFELGLNEIPLTSIRAAQLATEDREAGYKTGEQVAREWRQDFRRTQAMAGIPVDVRRAADQGSRQAAERIREYQEAQDRATSAPRPKRPAPVAVVDSDEELPYAPESPEYA